MRDTLSPQSITKNAALLQTLINLKDGKLSSPELELLKKEFSGDFRFNKTTQRQLIESGVVLNMADSKHRSRSRLNIRDSNDLEAANNSFIEYFRMRKTDEFIQDYLNYYSRVCQSDNAFELRDLATLVSPEHLRAFIEKNIKSEKITYLELEFLIAEMIRRLKLKEHYPEHGWPEDEKHPLHKNNLLHHIFQELLVDWRDIPVFNSLPDNTTEEAVRRLSFVILFHLNGVEGLTGFELSDQKLLTTYLTVDTFDIVSAVCFYQRSLFPVPLSEYDDDDDLIILHGATYNFKNAYLRNIDFQRIIIDFKVDFSHSDLRESNFESASINNQVLFDHANLEKANFRGVKYSLNPDFPGSLSFKNANLTQVDFENASFTPGETGGFFDLYAATLMIDNDLDLPASFFNRTQKKPRFSVIFDHAIMQRSNFSEAKIVGASFQSADLRNAVLKNTSLIGERTALKNNIPSNFSGADMRDMALEGQIVSELMKGGRNREGEIPTDIKERIDSYVKEYKRKRIEMNRSNENCDNIIQLIKRRDKEIYKLLLENLRVFFTNKSETKQKTRITESQYRKYFYTYPRDLFEIHPDPESKLQTTPAESSI